MLSYEQLTLNRCTRDVAVLHVNTNDLASINIIHSTYIKTAHATKVIKINKILQSKRYHNQFIFFDNGNLVMMIYATIVCIYVSKVPIN